MSDVWNFYWSKILSYTNRNKCTPDYKIIGAKCVSDKFFGEKCHMSNSRFDGGTVRVKNHYEIKIQVKVDFGIILLDT